MIQKYTLQKLLSQYTLFVPEIQREYVWGSKKNCEKVLIPFLKNIDENLSNNEEYNVGFLYSYSFKGTDKYIIDGQQRFTTLVLLMYVLSCIEKQDSLQDFKDVMSIKRPLMKFTYNVRPQTEVFMHKLFESGVCFADEIINQKWFLKVYETDMTIMSMVNAVDMITKSVSRLKNLNYKNILNRITFWYFNVNETSQGEELYITMNSRGQKLTASEHLKPYLFDQWNQDPISNEDKTDYGKEWDLWEEMFYHIKDPMQEIEVVSLAMDRFLQIVLEMEGEKGIKSLPNRTHIISLPVIKRYMKAMIKYAGENIKELLSDKNSDYKLLKSLIAEGLKSTHYPGDIKRIKNIVDNIENRRNYPCHHEAFLIFFHKYALSTLPFYDFVLSNLNLCTDVFDQHELDKIAICSKLQIDEVEEVFWEIQKYAIWSGNISPIISWACDNNNVETFNFERFLTYNDKVKELFADDALSKDDMDLVRRALLSQKLSNYPRCFAGRNYCFAKEGWHWKKLLRTNSEEFKSFFDKILTGKTLLQMIQEYPEKENYSEFVKDERLLKFCHQKNIQYWMGTWFLIEKERWSGPYANIKAYKYYLDKKDNEKVDGWLLNFYPKNKSCVYFDQDKKNKCHIAIDIIWNSGSDYDEIEVNVFLRNPKSEEETKEYLSLIESNLGYLWINGRYRKYTQMPEDEMEINKIVDSQRNDLFYIININNL